MRTIDRSPQVHYVSGLTLNYLTLWWLALKWKFQPDREIRLKVSDFLCTQKNLVKVVMDYEIAEPFLLVTKLSTCFHVKIYLEDTSPEEELLPWMSSGKDTITYRLVLDRFFTWGRPGGHPHIDPDGWVVFVIYQPPAWFMTRMFS